nr:uncharacterized protein LOC105876456 isoform X2 [Microcebus murinus]XP_012629586.1 uncharacterized protein LOC105876456 isoform X2 [Microcebus murinus]XP_012629587.1 uncharacterized protein LOC105876456 isoform X2 [Microcebus murinus]XP_012629588.1 uncharacterized protein LOC105876456 isoform X2 [Microcebus murinus]
MKGTPAPGNGQPRGTPRRAPTASSARNPLRPHLPTGLTRAHTCSQATSSSPGCNMQQTCAAGCFKVPQPHLPGGGSCIWDPLSWLHLCRGVSRARPRAGAADPVCPCPPRRPAPGRPAPGRLCSGRGPARGPAWERARVALPSGAGDRKAPSTGPAALGPADGQAGVCEASTGTVLGNLAAHRPAAVSRGDVEAPPSTGTERKKPGGRAWRKRARSCKAGDQRRPSGGKSRRMQDEAGAHGRTQPQPAGIPHHGPGVSGTGRATPLAQVGAARLPARPGPAMPGGRTVGGGTPALRAQSEG